eukprot:CAMPEP_0204903132 /NCGR_PEP_ID=MMETSP1397-20131031/4068_1 /ASSEMBLY_ACC=CAM_ASM_000891 /TAXON_ID=49980 /ORGANISM="Climacostomum Climacostomum virens, Strain Stock W-24" /LENGTH=252 /DNA_ID=CAMNT_0052071717 /DNA_START=1113 /DNA_END=1868 /DNA_ORIENTATION=-
MENQAPDEELDLEEKAFLRLLRSNPPVPNKKRKVGEVPMPEAVFERTLPGFLATVMKDAGKPCTEDFLVNEVTKVFPTLRKLSGNRYKGEIRHSVLSCMRTLNANFKQSDQGWELSSEAAFTELRRQTISTMKQRYNKEDKVIVNDEQVDPRAKDKFITLTMRYLKKLKQDPEISEELIHPLKPFTKTDKIEELRGWMGPDRFTGLLQGFNFFRNRFVDAYSGFLNPEATFSESLTLMESKITRIEKLMSRV